MPKASAHHSGKTTKLLLIGDSGAGKTGALVPLVEAGYKMFVVDYDNGIDILINVLRKSKPEVLDNLVYETFRDKITPPGGLPVKPVAYEQSMKLLTHWRNPERKFPDGTVLPADDYGPVASWGADTILVIDSLTMMGKAIMNWVKFVTPSKDGRADFFNAQTKMEEFIALVCGDQIRCNVIITSHIKYINEDTSSLGYPETIGTALSTKIGAFFNSILQVKALGTGGTGKRVIRTSPDGLVGLKNSRPGLPATLSLETGLAEYFRHVQGEEVKFKPI